MKLLPTYLEYFISPVTGRLSNPSQLPSLTEGNIWVGNEENIPTETDNYVNFGGTSSVNGNIAIFDGTSGRSIEDGGMSIPDLKSLADAAAASASNAAASATAAGSSAGLAAGSASAAAGFASSAEGSATAAGSSAAAALASAALALGYANSAEASASEADDDAAAAYQSRLAAEAVLAQLSYGNKTANCSTTATLNAAYDNGDSGVGATLTNAGTQVAFSVDGHSPAVGNRVLIKNQFLTFENGIYYVTDVGSGSTNWILTRAPDFDTSTNINNSGIITVVNGTINYNTGWILAGTINTVGTDAITFAQVGIGTGSPLSLDRGGTNASLAASNGGIFYSTATAGAILAGTATARRMLQSGATAAPAWSTTTWPATTSINRILYSSAANTISELSTANNGVLITNGVGTPSISATLPLISGGTNASLTASNGGIFYSTASAGAILAGIATSRKMLQSGTNSAPAWSGTRWPATSTQYRILYSASTDTIDEIPTANSSVLVTDSSGIPSLSTTLPSGIAATNMSLTTPTLGAATATSITFSPTTSGTVGTPTNDNASSGIVGEFSSNLGTATTLTSATTVSIASISLTAGDWDVSGSVLITPTVAAITVIDIAISTSSTVIPGFASGGRTIWRGSVTSFQIYPTGPRRISVSSTTTVYLLVNAIFAGNCSGEGFISARRVR